MDTLSPSPADRLRAAARWIRRRHNVLLFIGGFLFDVVTLKRIDSWLDLGVQLAYLVGLTLLLIGQHREQEKAWSPSGAAERLWTWNVEILHFLYGGLLSNYVVFYAKSGAGFRPLVFFLLLVALMVLNEMPQVRRLGHRLRLGLYAFCVASFLIYFVPVLIGRMGDAVFTLSIGLAAAAVWGVTTLLAETAPPAERSRARLRLAWPAGAVLAVIATLYALRLVPPVPLSVNFHGVYHHLTRESGEYRMESTRWPFPYYWRRDSRPFLFRPGDAVYYAARVFAPSRFHHKVAILWEALDASTGDFVFRARVPISITGGREKGYRAYSYFEGVKPGTWRVSVETEDGRVVGRMTFPVIEDKGDAPRPWRETRM